MLCTQKSRDQKFMIPREVLALSCCIMQMTCKPFWNGFYVKYVLSVQLSSIAVGILLYEILHFISLQFFLQKEFIFFSRQEQCICDICSERMIEERECKVKPYFHILCRRNCMLVHQNLMCLFK